MRHTLHAFTARLVGSVEGSFVHDAAGQAKDAAAEAGYMNLAGLIVIGGGLYLLNRMGS